MNHLPHKKNDSDDAGGFNPEHFAILARLEENNFWFTSRNRLIIAMLRKYCSTFSSFLEIGCGTGFVLSGIAKVFPTVKIYGSEIFVDGLGFAAARVPLATCIQMDARKIPFENEFAVIGAFDVLEHIKEDELVLAQIHHALQAQGILMLTVPQHAWLWSITDELACHERRYSRIDIEAKIKAAGFTILRSTSFIFTLLPAMFISRQFNQKNTVEEHDLLAEFNLPVWLNYLFESVLKLEVFLIRCGINFPIGGSRLVIAQKRQS